MPFRRGEFFRKEGKTVMPLSFATEGENIIKQVGGKAEVRAHLENLGFVAETPP